MTATVEGLRPFRADGPERASARTGRPMGATRDRDRDARLVVGGCSA